MKISRSSDVQQAVQARSQQRPRADRGQFDHGAPTRTTLSSGASFVQSVRDDVQRLSGVRADKVAEARLALAGGDVASTVDLDAMVSSLVGDL